MAPEQSTMFGCCVALVLFAAVGTFELAQSHAYGTCLIEEPGACVRSCTDDLYIHCTFSPVYANTTFAYGGRLKSCHWHTAPIFIGQEFCLRSLQPVGFTGQCAEIGGLCLDGFFARGGVLVGCIMLIISGCYTFFLSTMCYALWREKTRENEERLLRAVRID